MHDTFQRALDLFPLQSATERAHFLLALLRICDPADMTFLNNTIPRLHRDFFTLQQSIVTRIISYVHPKQLCRLACVSRAYCRQCNLRDVWEYMYAIIGMRDSAFPMLYKKGDLVGNVRRYLTLCNWTKAQYATQDVRLGRNALLALKVVNVLHLPRDIAQSEGNEPLVLTGGVDEKLIVADCRGKQLYATPPLLMGSINCIEVFGNHSNRKVFLGTSAGIIAVLDAASIATENAVAGEKQHLQAVNCLCIRPGARPNSLISGSSDKSVRIFDLVDQAAPVPRKAKTLDPDASSPITLQPLRVLWGHTSAVKCLEYTSSIILSCSVDGTMRVWDMETGNALAVYVPSATPRPLRQDPGRPSSQRPRTSPPPLATHAPNVSTATTSPAIYSLFVHGPTVMTTSTAGDIWWYKMRDLHKDLPADSDIESLLKVYATQSMFQYVRRLSCNQPAETPSSTTTGKWVLDLWLDDYKLITATATGDCQVWNCESGKLLYTLTLPSMPTSPAPPQQQQQQDEQTTASLMVPQMYRTSRAITKLWADDFRLIAVGTDGCLKIVDFADISHS
ncbi:hypothetical protein RI367_006115 [Sorochytrium milnesiophthora]